MLEAGNAMTVDALEERVAIFECEGAQTTPEKILGNEG